MRALSSIRGGVRGGNLFWEKREPVWKGKKKILGRDQICGPKKRGTLGGSNREIREI